MTACHIPGLQLPGIVSIAGVILGDTMWRVVAESEYIPIIAKIVRVLRDTDRKYTLLEEAADICDIAQDMGAPGGISGCGALCPLGSMGRYQCVDLCMPLSHLPTRRALADAVTRSMAIWNQSQGGK